MTKLNGVLLILVLLSCNEQFLERHESPSGQYSLYIERGTKDTPKDKYILVFNLVDKDKKELDHIRTGASDVMKWAVTWYNDNTIILDSHDIGTYAWTVEQDGKMIKIDNVTKEMIDKGAEAFKKKYGQ